MDYVVFETGGKQYKVKLGDIIEVDRTEGQNGSISFDKILLQVTSGEAKIGKPYLQGVSLSAKILDQAKGKKIRIARFTAKSRHRRVVGFRSSITRVQIEKISIA